MKPMQIYILCTVLFLSACLREILAKKEGETISEDKGVLVLTESNLNHALKQHSQLLVHFYAPLSGESLGSILEFAKAASELKENKSTVKLGKIDVSKEKDLAKLLNVTTVPSLRLYLSGDKYNPVQCPVLKSSTAILTWLKRREGPSADLITDLSQLESLTAEDELVVLGLFKDVETGLVRLFYDVAADIADLPFCVTGSEQIFSKYNIFDDSVVLLRKSKMAEIFKMTSKTVKEDVIHFIRVHEMSLVTEYNGKTSSKILNSVVLNHLILFIDKTENGFKQTYRAFKSAAKVYRGKILFVLIDTGEPRNGRTLEYFRVRKEESPLIRMVNLTNNFQYQLPSEQLDIQTITDFCQSYFLGNAKPKLQSEPIPDGWDKEPVKELVGINFERVAFNEKKNVLILLYAAWSSESRALFPLFEELAKHYNDTEDVVIARIDVTANDINILMADRYPSIKLFPAVYAEKVVPYSGPTKLEPIVEFVNAERAQAKKDKAKEEIERKKYLDAIAQKEAAKEEL
ncbi:protein disulfide-isomerase [Tachysurus fulvidraco]|uniref:protein disulfide-isomerase n=1 Tax=Tachysurus fulvidraco TaxID=1234273 RepID=UPI000F4D7905|nr:protein disulfide-isomerase [Tachysurus fulvidraco]